MEALHINTEPFKQHTEHLQRRSNPNADGIILEGPITLVDHTLSPNDNNFGCWARGAVVVDYIIVSGSPARGGAYVSWICSIETLEGVKFQVQKRYDLDSELQFGVLMKIQIFRVLCTTGKACGHFSKGPEIPPSTTAEKRNL
jgi:hypothetical protein